MAIGFPGIVVGGFLTLAVDANNEETVYAGNLGNSVFKNTNAGASWQAVKTAVHSN